jgi:hypothetical protein
MNGCVYHRMRVFAAAIGLFCASTPAVAQESGPAGIRCDRNSAPLREGTFRLSIGAVKLRGGHGCVRENPAVEDCDWTVELTRAEHWGPAPGFLLVVVHSSHRGGSGAWDSVFLSRCQEGKAVPVFSARYLYAATIHTGEARDFSITSGVWRSADPTCCPSDKQTEHFVWNVQRGTFVRTETRAGASRR